MQSLLQCPFERRTLAEKLKVKELGLDQPDNLIYFEELFAVPVCHSPTSKKCHHPPLVSGHSLTMCCMVSGSPQLQYRTWLTAHRPCPIRNWFSVDQCHRGRSKPGGQPDGSATREFITSVAAHSSLHWLSDPMVAGPARQVFSMTGGMQCDVRV